MRQTAWPKKRPPKNTPLLPDNTSKNKPDAPRTVLFYPLMVGAVILGCLIGLGIFMLIINNIEGRIIVPRLIFVLPAIVLIMAVKFIDKALAEHYPRLVSERQRRKYASTTGTAQSYGTHNPLQPYPQQSYDQVLPHSPGTGQGDGSIVDRSGQPAGYGIKPASTQPGQAGQSTAYGAPTATSHPIQSQYDQRSINQYGQSGQQGYPQRSS